MSFLCSPFTAVSASKSRGSGRFNRSRSSVALSAGDSSHLTGSAMASLSTAAETSVSSLATSVWFTGSGMASLSTASEPSLSWFVTSVWYGVAGVEHYGANVINHPNKSVNIHCLCSIYSQTDCNAHEFYAIFKSVKCSPLNWEMGCFSCHGPSSTSLRNRIRGKEGRYVLRGGLAGDTHCRFAMYFRLLCRPVGLHSAVIRPY